MDSARFDGLARGYAIHGTRRSALVAMLALALGGSAIAGSSEAEAGKKCKPCQRKKKGKCKGRKPDGTVCPGGTCQAGACIPTIVTCTMRNDPICESVPNCKCQVSGAATRYCGSYGAGDDPCETARSCSSSEDCPAGHFCDLGVYSFGTCEDAQGRCARFCGA